MRSSVWLASEDLTGLGDVKLKIEAVISHGTVKFDKGRAKDAVFALKFEGKDKQLALNSTNRKCLVRAFGSLTKNWKGQTITLYVDPGVSIGGKVVGGLRIREGQPETGAGAPD